MAAESNSAGNARSYSQRRREKRIVSCIPHGTTSIFRDASSSMDDSRPLQPYRGLDEVIRSIVMIGTRTLGMKKAILVQNGGFEPSEIRRVRLLAI
jgi:hypothetical protein